MQMYEYYTKETSIWHQTFPSKYMKSTQNVIQAVALGVVGRPDESTSHKSRSKPTVQKPNLILTLTYV